MKKKMLLAASLVLVSGGLSACGNNGEKSAGTVKNAVHIKGGQGSEQGA